MFVEVFQLHHTVFEGCGCANLFTEVSVKVQHLLRNTVRRCIVVDRVAIVSSSCHPVKVEGTLHHKVCFFQNLEIKVHYILIE